MYVIGLLPSVNGKYTKLAYERARGWTLGRSPPVQNFGEYSPHPPWVSKPFVRYAYPYPIHCKNTLGIVHLTTLETRRLGPR